MSSLHAKEPTVQWKNYIPTTVAARIENLLMDATTGKPIYGGRSRLLTVLLKEFLSKIPNDLDAPKLTEADIVLLEEGQVDE